MPDYVAMVMFAIYATMKMGEKIVTVVSEEVRDRNLVLPGMDVEAHLPSWRETLAYFSDEGKQYVAPGSIYAPWWEARELESQFRRKLRQALFAIQKKIPPEKTTDLEGYLRANLEAFFPAAQALAEVKQWREGADPKRHPVQRLAGAMLELALDYVKIDPTLFGGHGRGDRLLRGFLLSLDQAQFAEDDADDLLVDIARAALGIFNAQAHLLVSDQVVLPLCKNLTGVLAANFQAVKESNDADKMATLLRVQHEMLGHLVGAAAQTVAGYSDQFLGTSRGEKLLKGVLQATLGAVQEHPDLFSSSALAAIYGAALQAAAQNAALLAPAAGGRSDAFLAPLITGLARELAGGAAASPLSLFSLDLLPRISEIALGMVAQNASSLINPRKPEKQLLVEALSRVGLALAADFHGDQQLPEKLQALLSQDQVLRLLQEVFGAVALDPAALLQGVKKEPEYSALAQIAGSVALAVSSDTYNLLTGDGLVKLMGVSLRAFARNPDRLLELTTPAPQDNIMAQVLTSVFTSVGQNLKNGGRNLITGETLIQLLDAALATVSQNTEGFKKDRKIVTLTLDRLLFAASHTLDNELDAANLLAAFTPILRQALKGREVLEVSDAQLILPHLPTG